MKLQSHFNFFCVVVVGVWVFVVKGESKVIWVCVRNDTELPFMERTRVGREHLWSVAWGVLACALLFVLVWVHYFIFSSYFSLGPIFSIIFLLDPKFWHFSFQSSNIISFLFFINIHLCASIVISIRVIITRENDS